MITVDIPASFEWNQTNLNWVKHYLMPKTDLVIKLTHGTGLDTDNLDEDKFKAFCHQLEGTPEGRELRNKMFKAWRSKKSRDSDNGKKLYTFNLSIKAGIQLKKIAKQAPLNQTLESLIFAGKKSSEFDIQQEKKLEQLEAENKELKQQLANIDNNNDELQAESILAGDTQVTQLAKLEKSQLIKQILILKRKIKEL
ncbi:hypothetical protein E2R68_02225 [Psychromonas sp. RZ22]|uniref:hypothetical protein n=1 Tax=Psychromonas algarum TaxID=2555643 RepID=UPI001067F65E|nr:hypothetical protein [Psychromonas sp. RZ22]TEW55929.1 hypothetical protein E2R68_02225 [Psychromonas sp. RZ22]